MRPLTVPNSPTEVAIESAFQGGAHIDFAFRRGQVIPLNTAGTDGRFGIAEKPTGGNVQPTVHLLLHCVAETISRRIHIRAL